MTARIYTIRTKLETIAEIFARECLVELDAFKSAAMPAVVDDRGEFVSETRLRTIADLATPAGRLTFK